MRDPVPRLLNLYLFGVVSFEELQALQRRLVFDLGEGHVAGTLVLCEHPPILSVGRQGSRAHILADDDELRAREIPMRWVNRGGGCVLHTPGQLNASLILSLEAVGIDLNAYLRGLHEVLIELLKDLDIRNATVDPLFPGVFVGGARVGTVGVAVKRWTAYHGLTVNVGPYLEPYSLIDEPGPGGRPLRQSSLEALRQRPAPMGRVRESLIRQVEATFGLERHHPYTSHPMIRRKVTTHAIAFG